MKNILRHSIYLPTEKVQKFLEDSKTGSARLTNENESFSLGMKRQDGNYSKVYGDHTLISFKIYLDKDKNLAEEFFSYAKELEREYRKTSKNKLVETK